MDPVLLFIIISIVVYLVSAKVSVWLYKNLYGPATEDVMIRFSIHVCYLPVFNTGFILALVLLFILEFIWDGLSWFFE